MGILSGKVAWITGGGSGIGEAGARALAEAGALVVVSGRHQEGLDRIAESIRSSGGKAEGMACEVSDAQGVQRAADQILGRHGHIDILVASAGTNIGKRFWKDVTPAGWDLVVTVDLNGVTYSILAVLPSMRARKEGTVIIISSWAGRFPAYAAGPAYNAAKGALVAVGQSFNMEEGANGLRATVIMPGEVATPLLKKRPVPPPQEEMDRMLQPEDLGATIRFVAELPPRVCMNEILISPTWNRVFFGGADLAKK
jgi:NADP-dependent 3-hydroxy acid dehydrogenase YdfG